MKTNAFEIIGILAVAGFFTGILCLPGLIVSEKVKESYKEEVINELCNKASGKYDFCLLSSTSYQYKEKENNNE